MLQRALLLFAWMVCPMALAMSPSAIRLMQTEIETEIKDMLKDQLRPGEYFVYALVSPLQGDSVEGTGAALPYSSVRIPGSMLQKILDRNFGSKDQPDVTISVTMGFDERIPEAKRQLLQKIIQERFGFDGTTRMLSVQTLELITPPITFDQPDGSASEETRALERAKYESEQAQLRLQVERARMDAQQKQLEFTRQLNDERTRADQAVKTNDPVDQATAPASIAPEVAPVIYSPTMTLLKDFQMGLVAVVLGAAILVIMVIAGQMWKRGMEPVAGAIESIGSSIETAAKTAAPSQTSVTTVSEKKKSDGANNEREESGYVPGAAVFGAAALPPSAEMIDFVNLVQDKINVLSKEKNYSFYRTLGDMIESPETLPLAASVLLAIDDHTTKAIVADLSVDYLTRLKSFMATPGGLVKAKEMKTQALATFYGRIAMDEFQGSPLMRITNLGWLTKMTTLDMATFVVSLSDAERPVFLACLTPERVKQILSAASDSESKEKILRGVAEIDDVTEDRIEPVMADISKRMSSNNQESQSHQKFAVDGARYLANIASDLNVADQNQLFEFIKKKDQLVKGIKNHFIPFTTVTKLPKDLVLEIFGDQTDERIAQIIFDSDGSVRDKVTASLPEIRAESVKDELRTLDDDKFYEKRHRHASGQMQKEISKYLLQLNAEGLLNLEDKDSRLTGLNTSNDSAA